MAGPRALLGHFRAKVFIFRRGGDLYYPEKLPETILDLEDIGLGLIRLIGIITSWEMKTFF